MKHIQSILSYSLLLLLAYFLLISNHFTILAMGIALFLLGMFFMQEGFKRFSGSILEKILHFSTHTLKRAIFTGFITTAFMQSSSLISLIAISFLSAELLGLREAIGIIIGSNVGTTTTAWIVSTFGIKLNIASFAMPLVIFGVIFNFLKETNINAAGKILLGLGLLFLGIDYMKEGFEAAKETLLISTIAIHGIWGFLLYLFSGVAITVILQSSSATLAIIITALASGQINYESALILAIGANVGTTITAILGAATSNSNGKRLALAHLIFNLQTAIIALLLLDQLTLLVDIISQFFSISSQDYLLKLALFHTLFNLLGIFLILPWLTKLVSFLEHHFTKEEGSTVHAKYINHLSSSLPEVSLIALEKESVALYKRSKKIFAHTIHLHQADLNSEIEIEEILQNARVMLPLKIEKHYQNKIKPIYSEILFFSSQAHKEMSSEAKNRQNNLLEANQILVQSIKDCYYLERNFSQHFKSINPIVIDQYYQIRKFMLTVFRQIDNDVNNNTTSEQALKLIINQFEKEQKKTLLKEIAHKRIEQNIASSILNDISFSSKIAQKLIQFTTLLHGDRDD
jgi:phosphate:Na+ symporter